MRQRLSGSNWAQRTPAGLPLGMPGIGEEIEGAMQHAPQPTRHSICVLSPLPRCLTGC
jgi:oxygen-independent coproporphyrinogen-3 oxidase